MPRGLRVASVITRLDTARDTPLGASTVGRRLRAVRTTILLVLLAACGAAQRPRPTTGSIGGLARDNASGEPVAMASLALSNGARVTSLPNGLYVIDDITPGRYTLVAKFAGQPITIKNIDVRAGDATFVDVNFTLGSPDPILVDYGDPTQGAITHYRPKREITLIEGTVSELQTRERVIGAVVTAVGGPRAETLQTITDNHGRYKFDVVEPGTYVVSAYYNIGGRGQIEVRRAGIEVEHAQGVIVPIWVELAKQ